MEKNELRKASGRFGSAFLYCILLVMSFLGAAIFTVAAHPVAGAAVRLTVVSQPKDYTASLGGEFYFTVDVGRNDAAYRWQVSTDGGNEWTDSSVTLKEYSSTALAVRNGNLYRCVITAPDGSSAISAAAKLTVSSDFGIISQPEAYTGELGDDVVFEIQAGGDNISYQWEISADGTSWTPLSGSAGLPQRCKTNVRLSTVGKYYRCVIAAATGEKQASNAVRILLNGSGFRDYQGERFYMYEDGRRPSGITEIGGKYYNFSKDGVALSGFYKEEGVLYHFDGEAGVSGERFVYNKDNRFTYFIGMDGKAQTGWKDYNGKRYYCCKKGYMTRGLTDIDGGRYYFDFDTGEQKTGLIKVGVDTYMYFGGPDGRAVSGKQTIEGKTYYFSGEKESFGAALSGIVPIDGALYYFRGNYTLNTSEGFFALSRKTYYSDKDGKCLTGPNRIGGKLYLFGEDGVMKTGKQSFGGEDYCFADSGEALTGWYDANDGYRYYYRPDTGTLAKNKVTVDGVTYYLREDGSLKTGLFGIGDGTYYYAPDYTAFSGWIEDGGKRYYVNDDHTVMTGVHVIDGEKYLFSARGSMQTGISVIDGGKYYFSPCAVYGFKKLENGCTYYFREDGKIYTGLQKIDGKLYCFDDSGALLYGSRTIDGRIYFFDENSGAAQSGWVTVKNSNGSCYSLYFDPDTFRACTGLKKIDGKTYYFSENGFMQTGYLKIGGVVYYFDDVNGYAYTGFLYDKSKNHISYFDGANGVCKGPAIRRINGKYYCLDADNHLRTGVYFIDGKKYYFDPLSGEPFTGFFRDEGGVCYSDGRNGVLTGQQTVDGNKYRFGRSGSMVFGFESAGGKRFFYDENTGVRTYGIVKNKASGLAYCLLEDGSCGKVVRYGGVDYNVEADCTLRKGYSASAGMYFDKKTGERHFGLITFTTSDGSEHTYYFSDAGAAKADAKIRGDLSALKKTDGWKTYGSERYYVRNGEFLKGIQNLKGSDGREHRYCFSSLSGAMLTGLRSVDGAEYLFDAGSGEMLTGARKCGGRSYYFDTTSGKRVVGLVKSGGAVYCYLAGSGALKNCAACVNGTNYVFDKDGAGKKVDTGASEKLLPGMNVSAFEWITKGSGRFFTDARGNAVSGMRLIRKNLYYFDKNGLYTGEIGGRYFTENGMETGFVTVDGKTCYFDPVSGNKRYGELLIGTSLYYFDPDSGEMRTGWVNGKYYGSDGRNARGWLTLDGDSRWFDKNGKCAKGITKIPDGDGTYLFDNSGKMLTGFVNYCGKLYYAKTENPGRGKLQTGFVRTGGKLYYFDQDEFFAVSGMRTIEGRRYYFSPSEYHAEYGLVSVGANKYYFVEDGKGQLFGLVTLRDGTKRYFGESTGAMRTGLWSVDGVYYYFDPETGVSVKQMAQTPSGVYYCVGAGGGLLYGMQNIDGKDFYFTPRNGQAVFGLNSVGYKLYYFDENDGMIKNASVRVGDLLFRADETGALSVTGSRPIDRLVAGGIKRIGAPYYDRDEMTLESAIGTGTYSCSLLVKAIYEDIGIEIPPYCPVQYYALTHEKNYEVEQVASLRAARPGDIIYVSDPECQYGEECGFWGEIHHVAVYLGDGKVLEASVGDGSTGGGMTVRDYYESGKETYICAIVRLKETDTGKVPVYPQQVKLSSERLSYNGSVQQPVVTVTDASGRVLLENTDYSVIREASSEPGTYSVTVECRGAYEGKVTKRYAIERQDISAFAAALSESVFAYSGNPRKPVVSVTSPDGKKLVENTDYIVTYPGSASLGQQKVTVAGINNYAGKLTCTYTVTAQPLTGASLVVSENPLAFNGSRRTPSVTVKDAFGATLTKGVDYLEDMPYSIAPGTYTAVIRGIGGYSGKASVEYRITDSVHSEHTWDAGTVTEAPGCTTSGVRTFVCTVCGAIRTEECPAAGHTPGKAVRQNEIPATGEKAGSYDEVVFCKVCGAELSRKKKSIDVLPSGDITPKSGFVRISRTTNSIFIPANTLAGQLGELVNGDVRAVDKNGAVLSADKKLSTGCVLQLCLNGEPIREYTVIVLGDIDGDADISSSDARLTLRASVGLESYEKGSPEWIAGDAEYDGDLTSGDARIILRGSVGLEDPDKWETPA